LPVYSFFYDEENIYLIMQHIPHGDLRHIYLHGECVPEQQAARHMPDLVDVMMYYSREGIVHRDLESEYIFVGGTGNLIIADFGLAISSTSYSPEMMIDKFIVNWAPQMYAGNHCGNKEGGVCA
jgi:serine/threonine protein kinase